METFMARAHARGANAALVGWNLPYCRTALGDHLAACDWWPSGVLLGRPASLLATMRGQWVASSPLNSRVIQRERHEALLGLALERVADPGLDLVVLHLVPPHYPFIFDAQSGRYTFWSVGPRGYLGNLALADSTLAVLRRAIRRSGLEGVTTLVVTADHAWRTAHEFDGGTDSRVPLIVRLAAHAAADTVRTPVSTLRLGDLVAAALAGDLRDRASLDRWVAANAIASPVAP